MSDSVDREMTGMTANLKKSVQYVIDRLNDPVVRKDMSPAAMEKVAADMKDMITALIPASFSAVAASEPKTSK